MLYRPTEIHQTDTIHLKSSQSNQYRYQHGHSSILLAFPSESLTHITCFLNPPSLLALGRTNRYLNKHVNDDNTWHRAFVCQFLGIGPEGDLRNTKTLMLRRCENSWSKEFIARYNLRRRWERSHNSTITHTPHHSTVSGMQLMPETGLLTSSIEYGIVSRSLPLTGKILRGYLDASGTGLGNGNPNAEFTPNVSACALSSDGGTAKIIWGFRNGEVALMSANKAMDLGRTTAKLTRCKVDDEHAKTVQDAIWCTNNAFVTGALDGRVKLWDAKRVKCIWTSDIKDGSLIADPCVKVAATITEGVVVGVMKSGVIVVWTGLGTLLSEDAALPVQPIVSEFQISLPIDTVPEPSSPERNPAHDIMAIHLDHSTPCKLVILAAYLNNTHFYRLRVDPQSKSVAMTPFGEESSGSITVIKALFSDQEGEASFVIAGDQLGCIGIYDWGALPPPESLNGRPPFVRPSRKFEAHEDGAVTAIAWNSITLVSGSSRGTIKIWDSLTFTLLRSFSSPGARPPTGGEWDGVRQIILQRDLLIVSVGSRVMTWRAGPVGQRGQSTWKGKHVKRSKKNGASKGFQQLELYRDITESRQELNDEQAFVNRAYGRQKEQQSTLDKLGLDEVEALEYVLMLSRDEEQARMNSPSVSTEEGVFEGDFSDIQTPAGISTWSTRCSPGASHTTGRPVLRTSPSMSNHKVQVSPRFRAEPNEAGFCMSPLNIGASLSPPSTSSIAIDRRSTSSSVSADNFPLISPSTSNPSTPGTSFIRRSVSSSPEASRSAWSAPRRITPSLELSSPGSSSLLTSSRMSTSALRTSPIAVFTRSPSSEASMLSAQLAHNATPSINVNAEDASARSTEDMDEDLRFAIELSLVEARSRGHTV